MGISPIKSVLFPPICIAMLLPFIPTTGRKHLRRDKTQSLHLRRVGDYRTEQPTRSSKQIRHVLVSVMVGSVLAYWYNYKASPSTAHYPDQSPLMTEDCWPGPGIILCKYLRNIIERSGADGTDGKKRCWNLVRYHWTGKGGTRIVGILTGL